MGERANSAPLPWMQGGTGVTNFDAEALPTYRRAVNEYGDSDLQISDVPMLPMRTGYALLDLAHGKQRGRTKGLDEFWEVFRRVDREMKPK